MGNFRKVGHIILIVREDLSRHTVFGVCCMDGDLNEKILIACHGVTTIVTLWRCVWWVWSPLLTLSTSAM